MSNKLFASREVMERFSIDSLKRLEGCPPAVEFLKRKYGDRVDNLFSCGQEVMDLIVIDGKSDWAINFMLNLIKPEFRIAFYATKLGEMLTRTDDREFARDVYFMLKVHVEYMHHEFLAASHKFESHRSAIKSELNHYAERNEAPADSVLSALNHELLIVESVSFICADEKRNFTRSVTDALIKLAESKCTLDVVRYNYEEVIKETALELMGYTDIWK